MPVDQMDAAEASTTDETPDLLPEVNTPEAPPADAAIPADEGSAELADESSSEAEAVPADEPTSDIDDSLAQYAATYGLDATDFSNAASLRKAITKMDRTLADWYTKLNEPPQAQGQHQPQQRGYQQQAHQPQPAPGSFDLQKLLTEKFGPDIDPATRDVLTAMHDHYAQSFGGKLSQFEQVINHLPALVEKVQAFEAYQQQQDSQRFESEVDQAFAGLPAEWESIFGKGSLADLPPHSPQVQNRLAAVRQLEVLEQANARLGRKPEAVKALLERSLPLAFADHHNSLARKRVTNQLKRNNGAALARPSQKTGKPVDGIKRAVERNRKFDALVESLD